MVLDFEKVIHYHGTPITPRSKLLGMRGRHFCVSYAHPFDLEVVLDIGQSVMLDNGAFTAFTKGKPLDYDGYVQWADEVLQHPHWAIIPDVIGGSVEEQRDHLKRWPLPKDLSAAVFHLNLPLEWLQELVDNYPRICLGSSAEFWQVGTPSWERRMDEIFNVLCRKKYLPWVHGLRMLSVSDGRWPMASADSTNIARNHNRGEEPEEMADRIDCLNPSRKFKPDPQLNLLDENFS